MQAVDILRQRLGNQHLEGTALTDVRATVRWLCAVQSQDFGGAAWALAQRTVGATRASTETAFNDGLFLRTHVLRPTWHFVMPEDIRWMLDFSRPQLSRLMARNYRTLGLTDTVLAKTSETIASALAGKNS